MRARRRTAVVIAGVISLALALTGAACGKKDRVRVLLRELEQAAEARDAGRLQGLLAEDFLGPDGLTRAEAYSLLRRTFAAYEQVSIELYDVKVEELAAGPKVVFRTDFSGRGNSAFGLGGLLPPSASYRFELQLVTRSGRLLVSRAHWEDASPAQPSQEGGVVP